MHGQDRLSPSAGRAPFGAQRVKAHLVIHYRTFRNPDPPALVAVWNGSLSGRGAVPIRMATLLEYFTFAKPYFDPEGLILAFDDGRPVGFAHAGFAPNADGSGVDRQVGVLCTLGVLPDHRGKGVGSELLRRAEDYLKRRGARELLAGPQAPRNPYTFGLYGGARSPGFLDSDAQARPFLEGRGYHVRESALVFQRALDRVNVPADPRFLGHRQHYEILATPHHAGSWWEESVLGPVDLVEYRLQEKGTGRVAARATLWEMDTFNQYWGENGVGIVDLDVAPDLRRQGLAKFLLSQVLRHLHEQFFSLVEVHAPEANEPAVNLLRGLGFQHVDTGRLFARPDS
jgi:ribosomal protein S18 acetylase RimI-like enzyme